MACRVSDLEVSLELDGCTLRVVRLGWVRWGDHGARGEVVFARIPTCVVLYGEAAAVASHAFAAYRAVLVGFGW